MQVYIFVYLINFLLGITEFFSKKKILKKLSFVILNLFLCLKYINGIDWINYENWYYKTQIISKFFTKENLLFIQNTGAEFNFFILISIFRTLSFNYEMFQYFVLTFCMVILYKFFNKVTKYQLCLISFYFCSFMLVNYISPALRQILALTFFLMYFLEYEKNKKLSIFLLFLGISFHYSLIIMIPMLFFLKKEIKMIMYILLTFLTFIVNIFLLDIVNFILKYFVFLNKYIEYFNNEYSGGRSFNFSFEIIRIGIYLTILFYVKKNRKTNSFLNINIILNLFFLNFIFNIFRIKISAFERLEYYTLPFFLIVFSYVIEILNRKNKIRGLIFYAVLSIYFMKVLLTILTIYDEVDQIRYKPYTNYIVESINDRTFKTSDEKIEHRKLEFNRKEMLKLLKK